MAPVRLSDLLIFHAATVCLRRSPVYLCIKENDHVG